MVVTKTKKDNNMIDCIGMVYAETKIEMLRPTNQVWYVAKTRQDNDMINHISAVYTKNKYELLWSTTLSVFYDENQKRQRHDQLYKCGISKKWN